MARMKGSDKEKFRRLDKLFDSQIKALKNIDCPEKVIDILSSNEQKDKVLRACMKIRIPPNRLPFIPVITPAYCDIEQLMAMAMRRIGKRGKWENIEKEIERALGHGLIEREVLQDKYPVISAVGSELFLRPYFVPYYAINIEDGSATIGLPPYLAREKIFSKGRSPLTLEETISLVILTDVLADHNLWGAGSIWVEEGNIPRILPTDFGLSPRLSFGFYKDDYCRITGTPSCGRRLGLPNCA